jgi:pyridoxine 5-phosphate synthase
MKLSVNIDHVATLRQARGGKEPSPAQAARIVEKVGAHGITVHIRLDRRHIQESDVAEISKVVTLPVNIEMACDRSMLDLSARLRPATVTLVPEDPREITTRGGLKVAGNEKMISDFRKLSEKAGFRVSVFVDPDLSQISALADLGIRLIEINTGRYTEEFHGDQREPETDLIRQSARKARALGMIVAAGHGLNRENLPPIVALPEVEELNIGHSIVARSVFVGLEAAIKELLCTLPPSPSCEGPR